MPRCPRCASPEVRAIAAFESDHASHGLPREAARPRKRHALAWLLAALIAGAFLFREIEPANVGTLTLSALTLAGMWGAQSALSWNAREYPLRLAAWTRSSMCARCGAIVRLAERADDCQESVALSE
jgi:hypothetical protein